MRDPDLTRALDAIETKDIAMPATQERTIVFWDRVAETPVSIPDSALTLSGFCDWTQSDDFPSTGRISFLDGEVFVDMSPEDLATHNQVRRGLYKGWERFLDQFDIAMLIVDGMLLLNDDANLGTEPDGLLCLYESIRTGRVEYREVVEGSDRAVEVRGTADLVAEVVSRSSVRKDTVTLMNLYYRAGISEYWLVDARKSDIDFRIFTRGQTEFVPVAADTDGFIKSSVLNHRFRLVRTRNPVNCWQYSLEFRA